MADFEQTNNGDSLRSVGTAIAATGLGFLAALDVVVIKRWINEETIEPVLPAVGMGVGAVAVGVVVAMLGSED